MLKPVTLKNGLTVLRLPNSDSKLFTVGFVANTGTAVEKDTYPIGISYLIERMFRCGTDKHPSKRSLNTALDTIGGKYASITGHELTEYYITVPEQHQFKAISMLAEIIQRSYFDARDLEREKRELVEGNDQEETDLIYEGSYLGLANIYQGHGLGYPMLGEMDTIAQIKQGDILNYLSAQYQPEKAYLVISGNFKTKEATDLMGQEWSFWNPAPKKYKEIKNFRVEDKNLPKMTYNQRGSQETEIVAGFMLGEGMQPRRIKIATAEDQDLLNMEKIQDKFLTDWATQMMLNTILGQGKSSKLWVKGIEEERLFSGIQSNLVRFSDTGFLEISGTTDNSQFTFALESALLVLDSLKKTTTSMNDMVKTREYLKGQIIADQENLLSATVWQVENLIGSGLTFEIEDLITKINKIEAIQIRDLANKLFKKENFFLSTLGTAKKTMMVDRLVEKYL